MAEIKSTMELIMERTRNLTMSDEERLEQRTGEFRGGVNRLIQKYLQSELDVDRFQEALSRLEKDFENPGMALAVEEIAKRISPGEDNAPLLRLLRLGCEKNISGLEALLKNYEEQADLLSARASDDILEELRRSGITGTAVIPNLSADEELAKAQTVLHEKFRKNLAAQIEGLS